MAAGGDGLEKLGRWQRVALVARCAYRLSPLIAFPQYMRDGAAHAQTLRTAWKLAHEASVTGRPVSAAAAKACEKSTRFAETRLFAGSRDRALVLDAAKVALVAVRAAALPGVLGPESVNESPDLELVRRAIERQTHAIATASGIVEQPDFLASDLRDLENYSTPEAVMPSDWGPAWSLSPNLPETNRGGFQDLAAAHRAGIETGAVDRIAQACSSNRCVLFLGDQLATDAGYPSGRQLLEALIDTARKLKIPGEWASLRETLDRGDHSTVAEVVKATLGARLPELVAAIFITPPGAKLTPTHEILAEIPFDGVLAADWDAFVVQTFAKRTPLMLWPGSRREYEALLKDRGFFLVRLFGDPGRPSDFLFTHEDYRRALHTNEAFAKLITHVFSSRTLLFVGGDLASIQTHATSLPHPFNAPSVPHVALVRHAPGAYLQASVLEKNHSIEAIDYDGPEELAAFLEAVREKAGAIKPVSTRTDRPKRTLDRVVLSNIGPFASLDLALAEGWNLLLGDNGCGKSTLLRAIALGLCGDDATAQVAGASLLRDGTTQGSITLHVGADTFTTELVHTGREVKVKCHQMTPLQAGNWAVLGFPALRGAASQRLDGPGELPQDPSVRDLLPLLTGRLDTRLDQVKQWLVNISLVAMSTTGRPEVKRFQRLRDEFFDLMRRLTPGVDYTFERVDTSTWQVLVRTRDGVVPIESLSQGTSSILNWAGTLLERMYQVHDNETRPREQPALVLIDEVDAHMHPEWQRALVGLFRELFPRVQVVATTHSPLVLGSAADASVRVLERDDAGAIWVRKVDQSFEGWRADQILTSEAFGLESTISPKVRELLREHARLNARSKRTPKEEKRFLEVRTILRATLPSAGETAVERAAHAERLREADEARRTTPPEKRRAHLARAERLLRRRRKK